MPILITDLKLSSDLEDFLLENFKTDKDIASFICSLLNNEIRLELVSKEKCEEHLNWLNGMYDLYAASEDD